MYTLDKPCRWGHCERYECNGTCVECGRLRSRYNGMIARCYDPKSHRYAYYGARGIAVCDRWRESFAVFRSDMGFPLPGMSLDRIDNDGPYSVENCRWATAAQQAANKRGVRLYLYEGVMLPRKRIMALVGRPIGCAAGHQGYAALVVGGKCRRGHLLTQEDIGRQRSGNYCRQCRRQQRRKPFDNPNDGCTIPA